MESDFVEVTDCFADDRDSMNDFAKYFNNAHLSDITLRVGEEKFLAHRIILCKSSEVFDRMLSNDWRKEDNALLLNEDGDCQKVFANFLRFLYCNHIVLDSHNVLPLLILADKYAVLGLQNVCVEYAVEKVLSQLCLRQLIHVWFRYSTTTFHEKLTEKCVNRVADKFAELISNNSDWEEDWLNLDSDQLIELLNSNELSLNNEFELWEAFRRWLKSPKHPNRANDPALALKILPKIRFPFMSAEELAEVEISDEFKKFEDFLRPLTHQAFKYISMPLSSRACCEDFNGLQYVLREYKDNRWDKRILIDGDQLCQALQNRNEFHANFTTKASTYPRTHWEWQLTLRAAPSTSSYLGASRELSVDLCALDMDQQRAVEFMLMVTDDQQILRTFVNKRTFTKSRSNFAFELDNRLTLAELTCPEGILLSRGKLNLQLMFRPIV
ncbi:unnamed protein product [Bursaphelenchus xylophilus]|uniref:(pine wood nematode) hypothetical protein n=1 Tax=Bursaphelenchus xylophilus TaxID=6326 RepID=A0A1I7SXA7_BURXY|nr:unnamed protein product [Bursaphelenchus xylophilus]CAG9100292.1 unnamed protein product [Bursaphelenchus xylophilus]